MDTEARASKVRRRIEKAQTRLAELQVRLAELQDRDVGMGSMDYHVRRAARLSQGSRQHGCRPAADPLFWSAALSGGRRTLGLVLSGTLDDGADARDIAT